jgi:hypothetical protein
MRRAGPPTFSTRERIARDTSAGPPCSANVRRQVAERRHADPVQPGEQLAHPPVRGRHVGRRGLGQRHAGHERQQGDPALVVGVDHARRTGHPMLGAPLR